MTSRLDALPPPRTSAARRFAAWLHAHRRTRLSLLLTSPVGWLVIVYLGSLAILFANAFFTRDAFSGETIYEPTLRNFADLLKDPYPGITLRTVVMAVAVTLTCAVLALLLGLPALRLRADYLAIVTIAASEIIRTVMRSVSLRDFSGGSNGINGFAQAFYDANPFDPQERYGLWKVTFLGETFWIICMGWLIVGIADNTLGAYRSWD